VSVQEFELKFEMIIEAIICRSELIIVIETVFNDVGAD